LTGSPDEDGMTDESPLDSPVRASLLGAHARFAEGRGEVLRYPVDVAPFVSLPPEPDEGTWRDAAALLGPGAMVPLAGVLTSPPPGWDVVVGGEGVQLIDDGVDAIGDVEAVRLGAADVPEMLDLVGRTKPGPFLPRTVDLGTYLGIRKGGALVAMAGERMHPPGWTEISAVCTDAAFRGQGLATRLVLAVAANIRDRGETPFMHAVATNTNAIGLYESLGFRVRRKVTFLSARVPG
jgi:GNAT superfamily N-acetyltransferase